jgi:hypothetical protein
VPDKNPTSLSAFAFLVVARRRRMGLCLSALEWRFPAPSRAAATALPKAGAKPEGLEETDLWPLHFFLSFSAQKSHVKPQNSPNLHLKPRNTNKPNRLHAKNKSAELGILVSLNPLK